MPLLRAAASVPPPARLFPDRPPPSPPPSGLPFPHPLLVIPAEAGIHSAWHGHLAHDGNTGATPAQACHSRGGGNPRRGMGILPMTAPRAGRLRKLVIPAKAGIHGPRLREGDSVMWRWRRS